MSISVMEKEGWAESERDQITTCTTNTFFFTHKKKRIIALDIGWWIKSKLGKRTRLSLVGRMGRIVLSSS